MISIAEAISDLLFVRDTVVVPGLGAFVKTPVSAKVNPVANYFATPASEISFDANLREDNDLVINYMSEKNDIPEEEARRLLAMFVSDCFNSLKEGKKVTLANVGKIFYDWAGDLAFEQDKALNYNADAFGLCDFEPEPVLRAKTKEEIKAEIAQQQKEKNTPVTVDEEAVHQKDDKEEQEDEGNPHHGWLWILLGLLLVAATLLGLHYFKVIDLGLGDWGKQPKRVYGEPQNWAENMPVYTMDWDVRTSYSQKETTETEPVANDTINQPIVEPTENPVVQPTEEPVVEPTEEPVIEPVAEVPEANIRIIAGCFAQEDNAQRLVSSLKSKGYTEAFCELRGNKWFVSFGRYATDEEATAALREIRANTEYKAWILK